MASSKEQEILQACSGNVRLRSNFTALLYILMRDEVGAGHMSTLCEIAGPGKTGSCGWPRVVAEEMAAQLGYEENTPPVWFMQALMYENGVTYCMQPSKLQGYVNDIARADTDTHKYVNGWLALYADHLETRLHARNSG